jgi:predicted phosphoribosyltransferase
MTATFDDRSHAGRRLAERVAAISLHDPLVVGIAPGGIPVAREVAHAIGARLEAWMAHPLVAGEHAHAHVGGIAEDGCATHVVCAGGSDLPPERLRALAEEAGPELIARARALHRHPRASMRNHTVVLVDDGVSTGATMRAAVRAIRQEKPHRIVVAVPILVRSALTHLERWVDEIVFVADCQAEEGIGAAYRRFDPVSDAAAAEIVAHAHAERAHGHAEPHRAHGSRA